MSTETTNKKIKIDNGTTFGRTYTDKAVDELLKNVGGGITTANISPKTLQLDTSSLTAKDQYILACMDNGEGNIHYMPFQTYLLNDGYFNKEVKLQISSHDFRLSLASASFQSYNNYTLNAKATNIDFTNTLDSTNTWTKLGDIKYIAIEEQDVLAGESSHKYLEISSGLTFPTTSPTSQLIPSITTTNTQQNLTIGNGLEIKDGALDIKSNVVKINTYSININKTEISTTNDTGILSFAESAITKNTALFNLLAQNENNILNIKVKLNLADGTSFLIFMDYHKASSINFENIQGVVLTGVNADYHLFKVNEYQSNANLQEYYGYLSSVDVVVNYY